MRSLRARLPRPAALVTFEAAARLESFTEAGRELGVTQAAVSHAIRALEADLGVALFRRGHRQVELTANGRRFLADVAVGLGHIDRAAEALRRAASDSRVTVCSSTAFASHWMIPRIARLRARFPEIDIRLQTSDRDIEIAADPQLVAIRRGAAAWPDGEAKPIAAEALVPVCSPAFLRDHSGWAEDRTGRALIHLEEPFRPRPSWRDWFAQSGLAFADRGEGLRLNDYGLVVQAAIGGQGVALGWRHIVDHALRQGLLVAASEGVWLTGMTFYAVAGSGVEPSSATRRVIDWMAAEACA